MATHAHRKVKRLKLSFNDDVDIIAIHDVYPGERFVDNLKSTILQAKAQSREDWLTSDGAATSYCLERPVYKLLHIEHSERTMAEHGLGESA